MELFDFSQYTWWIAVVQILVALLIFFITNWLGGHTPVSKGYITLSLIAADDTMPAFNFLFKTLTPLVQYILFVALCQMVSPMNALLANSYMIIVYYWLWRAIYYIARGAFFLANWPVFIVYSIVGVGIAIWIYSFVERLGSILPSKEALRDQLWILIAIFVYQVFNNLQINRKGTEDRKRMYALRKYHEFKARFADVVDSKCKYIVDADILYAIMIVENYNRPALARVVENLKFRLTHKKMSLGIMQVKTTEMIDDYESVERAAEIIYELHKEYIKAAKEDETGYHGTLCGYIDFIAGQYNGGDSLYQNEVNAIFEIINELQIKKTIDVDLDDVLKYTMPKWRKKKQEKVVYSKV